MLSINNSRNRTFSPITLTLLLGLTMLYSIFLLKNPSEDLEDARFNPNMTVPAMVDSSRKDTSCTFLDTSRYNMLLLHLTHNRPLDRWPVKAPYPLPGALLPFNRIIAYYGNFYSKGMGILGELPEQEVLQKLRAEMIKWQEADPSVPALPAIHYIVVTAQDRPGGDRKYRLRMPASEINKALAMARKIKGIVFLDVQVGWSTLQEELPLLEPYLKLPDVHLGIDPEYSMKGKEVPCTVIGAYDAADINYAAGYLAAVVKKYKLAPKILVVHRFTKEMVTNYSHIATRPEVQIVMNMDGFGTPAKKIDSYKGAIAKEPVQFTGFKLFYHYDLDKKHRSIMQPGEILALYPSPIYVQYQ